MQSDFGKLALGPPQWKEKESIFISVTCYTIHDGEADDAAGQIEVTVDVLIDINNEGG